MEQTLLQKLEEKFTKANVYAILVEFNKNNPAETEEAENELLAIIAAVKPQKGGASTNPSYEEDGITYHYCRFRQGYLPEDRMNMSGGKTKGSGILESKIAYRITKKVDELKAQALNAFTEKQDYELGAKLNAEAAELIKTIELAETFTDEAMANSEFHPDFGKDKKEENKTNTDEESSEVI